MKNTKCEIPEIILEAADRLIGIYGYNKTTVDDIAHEAGIGKGTIYLYFKSKEELALSCINRMNQGLHEELRVIADSCCTPDNKIRQMLMKRIMVRFDHVQHYSKSIDDLLMALRPILQVQRERNHDLEARIFADVLTEGFNTGVFKFEDSYQTAAALVLATNSLLPYSLSARQLGDRDGIINKASLIINLLLKGLMNKI